MATLTANSLYDVCIQDGAQLTTCRVDLSNDYVLGSETLDLSSYVGTIYSALIGKMDQDAYVITEDYANSDYANGVVSFASTEGANAAASAANTDLSGVDLQLWIFSAPRG